MLTFLTMTMFVAMSADAPGPTDGHAPPDRAPSMMTGTEIKAHNQGLPMTHPYYVKCRKMEVPGSLVKKLRVCHTNENSRDIMQAYSSKAGNCLADGTC